MNNPAYDLPDIPPALYTPYIFDGKMKYTEPYGTTKLLGERLARLGAQPMFLPSGSSPHFLAKTHTFNPLGAGAQRVLDSSLQYNVFHVQRLSNKLKRCQVIVGAALAPSRNARELIAPPLQGSNVNYWTVSQRTAR